MTRNLEHFFTCFGGGVILTVLNFLIGKVDYSISFLFIVIILDFITGMMSGALNHKLSSSACTKGLCKKLMVFIYIIIAHHMDMLLHLDYIRIGVCYLYATGEILSIIENGTKIGVPVPEPIKKALEIIQDKDGGKKND